jgi:hypothetical protein
MLTPFHQHPGQHVRPQFPPTQPPTTTPSGDFDPDLLKPVAFQPAPLVPAIERQQLEAELGCLRREAAQIQKAIDYRQHQLGL